MQPARQCRWAKILTPYCAGVFLHLLILLSLLPTLWPSRALGARSHRQGTGRPGGLGEGKKIFFLNLVFTGLINPSARHDPAPTQPRRGETKNDPHFAKPPGNFCQRGISWHGMVRRGWGPSPEPLARPLAPSTSYCGTADAGLSGSKPVYPCSNP